MVLARSGDNAMYQDYKYSDLTEVIIKAFYKVYNRLGYGFREKVCANALAVELRKAGHEALREAQIEVYYEERSSASIQPMYWLTRKSSLKPNQNVSSSKIMRRNC